MPSIYELALCCDAVYTPDKAVPNWTRIADTSNQKTGMFAALFQKENEYILAFRGTETSLPSILKDIDDDLMIAFGVEPEQFKSAKQAYNLARLTIGDNSPLILTGHSLGGGLAALVAAKVRPDPVVTFNSPGMRNSTISQAKRTRLYASAVLAFGGYYQQTYDLLSETDEFKMYGIRKHKALHIRSEMDIVSISTGSRIKSRVSTYSNNICKPEPMMTLNPQTMINAISSLASSLGCAHKIASLIPNLAQHPELMEEINWALYE